jgi:hypothetical protein
MVLTLSKGQRELGRLCSEQSGRCLMRRDGADQNRRGEWDSVVGAGWLGES